MVFDEIVLERRSCESDASERLHLVNDSRDGGGLVLQQMALVANDKVGPGVGQTFLEDRAQLTGNPGAYGERKGEVLSVGLAVKSLQDS